jgi:hypothetical protein
MPKNSNVKSMTNLKLPGPAYRQAEIPSGEKEISF